MKIITRKNVSKRISQFNAEHLTRARAYIKNEGWQNIKIEQEFYESSIKEITALLSRKKEIQEIIKFRLKNQPFHYWGAIRFIYDYSIQKWKYIPGQDYNSEIGIIRKYLSK